MSRRTTSFWHAILILAAWIMLVGLHWSNNGLWFQGDAARHAGNGLFWKAYLSAPTIEAKEFALSYYARYPVINPIAYPPFFYIVEAGAYWIFGPSALVAKNLVLFFALICAAYVQAWLRRWVSPDVSWAAALFLLLPGVIRWSHAVMLNIPSVALILASIYHGRRWAERHEFSLRSGHFYLSVILGLLAILTYYPAGVVFFVLITVICISSGWRFFARWQNLLLGLSGVLLLVPCFLLLARWNPSQVNWLIRQSSRRMWQARSWQFYPEHFSDVFGWTILALAGLGLVLGLLSVRWRRETLLLSAWLAVTYVVFSIVMFKDARYILSLGAPLVGLCAIGIAWMADRLFRVVEQNRLSRIIATLGVIIVLGMHASFAWYIPVPSVHGYSEVVAFLEEVAPNELVFYDGPHYNGVFTFHVQASDPEHRRGVVLGNKLLYSYAMRPGARQTEYVSSPEDVVETLRTRGGCRWLAIERGKRSQSTPGMRYLRQALEGPEFELVRSFPIISSYVARVDVYRILGPISREETIRLPFPYVSKDTVFEVRPMPPRTPPGPSNHR